MPEEPIVVAGLLRRRGRALLVHRSPQRRWYPDAWDLPGGHVEVGEVPRLALARELREELGIAAEVVGDAFAKLQGVDFRIAQRHAGIASKHPFKRRVQKLRESRVGQAQTLQLLISQPGQGVVLLRGTVGRLSSPLIDRPDVHPLATIGAPASHG